jgi:hypothetical protein
MTKMDIREELSSHSFFREQNRKRAKDFIGDKTFYANCRRRLLLSSTPPLLPLFARAFITFATANAVKAGLFPLCKGGIGMAMAAFFVLKRLAKHKKCFLWNVSLIFLATTEKCPLGGLHDPKVHELDFLVQPYCFRCQFFPALVGQLLSFFFATEVKMQ